MIRLADYPWPVAALIIIVALALLLVLSMGLSMLMIELTMNIPDRRRMRKRELDRAHEDRSKYRRDLLHEWNADYRRLVEANTREPVCTCPSGDGSLRWPCPVHKPTDPEA